MATLRPSTNLVIPEDLMLPKRELKSKFLYVYNKGFTGSQVAFMTKLWASVFFPAIASDPKFGAKGGKAVADAVRKSVASGYLKLEKVLDTNEPHFIAHVPLYSFPKSNPASAMNFLRNWMLGENRVKKDAAPTEPTAEQIQNLKDLGERFTDAPADQTFHITYSGAQVAEKFPRLDEAGKTNLKQTLMNVRATTKGNLVVIFAEFKITKEISQQLTTTPWIELRTIDLYPLLLQWCSSGWGETSPAPIASFPISKIAFTLPANHHEAARVTEDGLSISPNGRPYFLPKGLDRQQTVLYEDRYAQAGTREDGSYSLQTMDEGAMSMDLGAAPKVKLPVNMPVCIDWVNAKYSFTNTTGFLEVMDLMRFRTADISHIRTLLEERQMTDALLNGIVAMGTAANVPASAFKATEQDFADLSLGAQLENDFAKSMNDPINWLKFSGIAYNKLEGEGMPKMADFSAEGFKPLRPLALYFKTIYAAVSQNLESVYNKYSVRTVSQNFAWLTMIVKYADKMVEVRAADNENRKAAINQGVDPNWKPDAVPLLDEKNGIGFLPHQSKVRNLLRDSPDFAFLPVQAGGGKSLLLLTDILYEIKANRSAPYLVICPGHLVANYVKEVVYFTGGKLNVIALSSYAIRVNGWERLQAIMNAAPRNTVVVCDYDVLRYRAKTICYGTSPTPMFPVIDFLRQFAFGYVALDESHKVKNDTSRTRATMALITDIPKKRLASGTMVHDSPSDMVSQVAIMDPTLFGSRDEFNAKYGETVAGDRVVKWKEGAQELIQHKINSRIIQAKAMRKEWAALLPTKREWIGGVELTEAQQNVYDDILDETLVRIQEDAKKNKALAKFVAGGKASSPAKDEGEGGNLGDEDEADDQDNAVDEDAGEDLASLLKPYLSRMEAFLIAPGKDPLGSKVLQDDDKISPKTRAILDRVRAHIFGSQVRNPKTGEMENYGPFPGKVLIFTNNIVSAEEVFEVADDKLKECGILYKAARKLEDGAKFEKDDRIKWMVGVEKSMNEGLNFQFASRLIRTETVWNPGTLEQGNSRINRPELKKKETRNEIFYDTVVCNKTIDITKTARLISKVIAIAKFENSDVPEYADVPDVPIIAMNLDSIRNMNSWHGDGTEENPGLMDYNLALAKLEEVRIQDYEDYKQAYIEKHGEGPVKQLIPVGETPQDAKLLRRVPYAPGLGIYNAEEMGLVRVDEFLNMAPDDDFADEADEGDDDQQEDGADVVLSPIQIKCNELKGMLVHTEYGEGYVKSCSPKTPSITVLLTSGYAARVRKTSCFVVTRGETSNKDIRNQLLKSVGDLPIAKPIDVPAAIFKASKAAQKLMEKKVEKVVEEKKVVKEKQKSALAIELSFIVANGYFGVSYLVDEENQTASRVLGAQGFRPTSAFYYSKVVNANALKAQLNLWQKVGLRPDPVIMKAGGREAFAEMYALLKSGKIKNHAETIRAAGAANMKNFYRLEHKASNDKMLFKPYPIIEDGVAYIALPISGQAGSREAMKHKRPSFRWNEASPTLQFFGSPAQVNQKIKQLVDAGVQVTNIDELRLEFKKISKMKVRSDEQIKKDLDI